VAAGHGYLITANRRRHDELSIILADNDATITTAHLPVPACSTTSLFRDARDGAAYTDAATRV